MNYPSIKTLAHAFPELTLDQHKTIRGIMDRTIPPTAEERAKVYGGTRPLSRMERIDRVLETCGVEYVPAGRGARSPAFYYCNTGDTYAVTIIRCGQRFTVGTWGDRVERGFYR